MGRPLGSFWKAFHPPSPTIAFEERDLSPACWGKGLLGVWALGFCPLRVSKLLAVGADEQADPCLLGGTGVARAQQTSSGAVAMLGALREELHYVLGAVPGQDRTLTLQWGK